MRDADITAESDFMRHRRRDLEHQRQGEEKFYIAVEAEKAFEELPEGQETPEFADGTRAIVLKLRDSIARDLYEELDQRYGDE